MGRSPFGKRRKADPVLRRRQVADVPAQALAHRSGRPEGDQPVVGNVCEALREAKELQADLRPADVKKGVLFAEDPAMSRSGSMDEGDFHDVGTTRWPLYAWIEKRTGHQSKEMMHRCTRAAQTLADLRYALFPESVERS
jgi:hypothetical protein